MDNGEEYSTLTRLLQIEGPTFVENVANTFEMAGIPRDKVEEVLTWAIGDDFHTIQLKYWPHRLNERLKFDIKPTDLVKDTLPKIAMAWKEKNDNDRNA